MACARPRAAERKRNSRPCPGNRKNRHKTVHDCVKRIKIIWKQLKCAKRHRQLFCTGPINLKCSTSFLNNSTHTRYMRRFMLAIMRNEHSMPAMSNIKRIIKIGHKIVPSRGIEPGSRWCKSTADTIKPLIARRSVGTQKNLKIYNVEIRLLPVPVRTGTRTVRDMYRLDGIKNQTTAKQTNERTNEDECTHGKKKNVWLVERKH